MPIGGQSGILFDLSVFWIGDEMSRYEVSSHIVLPLVFSVPVDLRWCFHPMLRVVPLSRWGIVTWIGSGLACFLSIQCQSSVNRVVLDRQSGQGLAEWHRVEYRIGDELAMDW